jgi:photosystem II stability/assembly factor-like uncharacterized protein
MQRPRKGSILVLVGTRKGAFAFSSDARRKTWKIEGPWFAGNQIHHFVRDDRDHGTLLVAVNNDWFGPDIQRSSDWGRTWKPTQGGVRYGKDSGLSVKRIWHVRPGRPTEPGVVYAGVDPAGLFRSGDNGATWEEVTGLNRHETREKWTPGAGGLILHTVLLPPGRPERIYVAISAAGVFRSVDAGKTWQPRNQNTRADFLPQKHPQVGQCVHKLVFSAGPADLLYQQNHCGVYRSESGGDDWIDISNGLPSRFGFPMVAHPREPRTVWVIPHISAEFRVCPDGAVAVYRSTSGGRTWSKQARGLPARNAFLTVLREAMSTEACDPAGIYFGTQTGQLFYSRDEGRQWGLLADHLPPILSVEASVV